MKILVLGGTQFLGRHIVDVLTSAGHGVTVFNRGITPDPLALGIERLHGDRDLGADGLRALRMRTWDACVDVSGYTPTQVRASVAALRDCVARYVYISAVSAYNHGKSDAVDAPVTESNPLMPPASDLQMEVNGDTYGPLKVACEAIVQAQFAGSCSILRPQVITGAHDDSGRLSRWIMRARRSQSNDTPMLAPGDGSDYLQLIDVRDVANFIKTTVECDHSGIYNLSGHRITWAKFLQLLDAKNCVWVSAKILSDANLSFSELPLYRANGSPRSSLMNVSCETALAAGLVLSSFADTISNVKQWLGTTLVDDAFEPLSTEREAQLIALSQLESNLSLFGI